MPSGETRYSYDPVSVAEEASSYEAREADLTPTVELFVAIVAQDIDADAARETVSTRWAWATVVLRLLGVVLLAVVVFLGLRLLAWWLSRRRKARRDTDGLRAAARADLQRLAARVRGPGDGEADVRVAEAYTTVHRAFESARTDEDYRTVRADVARGLRLADAPPDAGRRRSGRRRRRERR